MQSPDSANVEASSPQQFQVSTQAVKNDPIYLCSEGALRSLFSFFSISLSAGCCDCGKPLEPDSISFNRQSHAVSVSISCICGDSFKWLSSPIMGGSTPKYYLNMRYDYSDFSFCYQILNFSERKINVTINDYDTSDVDDDDDNDVFH